jgi:hypothetical protein
MIGLNLSGSLFPPPPALQDRNPDVTHDRIVKDYSLEEHRYKLSVQLCRENEHLPDDRGTVHHITGHEGPEGE